MAAEAPHNLDAQASTGPSGEIVRLVVASAVAVVIFAGGVYWLRHLPTQPPAQEAGGTIQVRLLQTPEPTPHSFVAAEPEATPTQGEHQQQSPDQSEDVLSEKVVPSPHMAVARVKLQQSSALRPSPTTVRRAPPDLALRFQQALQRHIARFQRYPARARDGGLEGTVQVLFLLRRDGTVVDAWIESTSGETILDKEAMETVHRAEPLPPIPGELPDQLRVLLPVAFALP
jgi:protein TonB